MSASLTTEMFPENVILDTRINHYTFLRKVWLELHNAFEEKDKLFHVEVLHAAILRNNFRQLKPHATRQFAQTIEEHIELIHDILILLKDIKPIGDLKKFYEYLKDFEPTIDFCRQNKTRIDNRIFRVCKGSFPFVGARK